MPEMRRDPVNGRWVIIAPDRAGRPHDFHQLSGSVENVLECPFCAGKENETPPEIAALRSAGSPADGPGWRARLVPNRYPALRLLGGADQSGDPLRRRMSAAGSHDVLIETPHHEEGLADMDLDHIAAMLRLCRDRMARLYDDRRISHVMLFKNHGAKAGASLSHSHSQIIALPVVPKHLLEELAGAARYHRETGRCIFCCMVEAEERDGERLVRRSAGFAALAAFAPRKPYETWIIPRRHAARFERAGDAELLALAEMIKVLLTRIKGLLGNPPFNLVLHTSPKGEEDRDSYHWHLELLPEFTWIAGFEWGAGVYINHVAPEQAAAQLRGTDGVAQGGDWS
jgi:UDPglucose--hexose-1-phosphate uridylyltransferase